MTKQEKEGEGERVGEPKRKVLFFPINSPGHTNGSIALADYLSNVYNYKCIFVVTGKCSLANSIKSREHKLIELSDCGALFRDDENVDGNVGGVKLWSDMISSNREGLTSDTMVALKTMLNLSNKSYVRVFIRNCHQYNEIIKREKANLIVLDNLFPPPFLMTDEGERQFPWVHIHSMNPLDLFESINNHERPVPRLGCKLMGKVDRIKLRIEQAEQWQEIVSEWQRQADEVKPIVWSTFTNPLLEYYQSLGLTHKLNYLTDQLDTMPVVHSPYLNIYLYPEAIDYTQDDDLFLKPKLYLQCNSLVRESLPSKSEQEYWLKLIEEKSCGKEAKILFSLGSLACGDLELMNRFLKMFANDQKNLYIVSKGVRGDEIELNEANMIGANYIPQPFLLQHVDLAIIHGGNNGFYECLHYGVPVIIVPLFTDQFDNAQRVEDVRVGRRLDTHKCSELELLSAVNELLSDSELRQRVKEIGTKMQERNEIARVAELLHQLAEKKHLDAQTLEKHNVRI